MGGGLGGTAIYRNNTRKSACLERYQPNIANNVAQRTPLFDFLKDKTKKYTGGTEFAVKFRHSRIGKLGEDTNVGAYSYYDELSCQPFDNVKTGTETKANFNVPIAISHQEQRENSGENEFDLVKQKTETALDELSMNLEDVAWGVAGGDSSKYFTSIPEIVSGADAGTIHGLSKASNTWLYSQYDAAIGDAATNLFDKLDVAFDKCIDVAPNKTTDKLSQYFFDRTVYNVLKSQLHSYIEYSSNKDVDIGIVGFNYGGVKVTFDSTLPLDPAGLHQGFGLMGKYWEWAVEKTMNFKVTPFYDRMPIQAADVAQVLLECAVICSVPRTNWWGYGITV
jgi:hypothetical protein